MSNDRTTSAGRKPPRAEPLQPDKPGAGDELTRAPEEAPQRGEATRDSARRQKQQSDTALDNVRKGYD
ncbi:hypothetical protein [Rhizobacter sp. OV335]|jgi:hypothetical protein|uniref:hypothetical protein n=1 Tax=Rhizobacter sp. OV335 TaxID=1500264 RepID=UPI00091EDB23|nr:hypothetical protein [Rhizobacter sp. OV335]SHM53743.1 hypothetical protein SAMN02787076_01543 [Rhizobacter sp. OV335]